ncbi:MAG: Peptide chain release factor subunit 1 [Candidatus Woesearchaeota archaeon]|nr:Peptide chain release factor subunit 1 [Candidatus Woesearchaeota archaeon]
MYLIFKIADKYLNNTRDYSFAMAINARQKHKLKKFIKNLEDYRGRHTELVSVYIPAGYDIYKILSHLAEEQGTAANIKDSTTRKNVTDALERMIQHLRLFKKTPPNGLAVFSGNVSERQGKQDIDVFSIEPPIPLNTRTYRCDKEFELDLLRKMLESKDVYGLVVMDRREGNVALLKGKTIIQLSKKKSNVPGKTRAGGQSAQRFARLREGAAKQFYKRLGELMKNEFLHNPNIKGIIVGGPGHTKNDFVDGNYITNEVKKKILAIKDVAYTGESGLHELLDRSQDVLASEEIAAEKKIMREFFELLATKPKKVAYGETEVMKNLKIGAVETLLISEEFDDDKLDKFDRVAGDFGSDLEIISTETREGVQLKDLGMIAAILRYETYS